METARIRPRTGKNALDKEAVIRCLERQLVKVHADGDLTWVKFNPRQMNEENPESLVLIEKALANSGWEAWNRINFEFDGQVPGRWWSTIKLFAVLVICGLRPEYQRGKFTVNAPSHTWALLYGLDDVFTLVFDPVDLV